MIKIFVVDDHPIVFEGLRSIFSDETDIELCGFTDNTDDAHQAIKKQQPQLLISDINIKGLNVGIDFISQTKKLFPDLKIVAVSMLEEGIYAERAARAGAMGYVMKSELTSKIISAVREVMQGQVFFSPTILSKMISTLQRDPDNTGELWQTLSNREIQVFELIAEGVGTKEISEKLGLSPKTIDTYKYRLRAKLNLENNADLTKYAIQESKIKKTLEQ